VTVTLCDGCYQNWRGDWWCDNCDQWPCLCDVHPAAAGYGWLGALRARQP
jgi:hypothetical protein